MSAPTLKQRALALVAVSRVAGWCFGPILFGIGLVHSQRIPRTLPGLLYVGVQIAALSFPLCIVVFGVNDVYDYESDRLNPRKVADALQGGILRPEYHRDVLLAATISSVLVVLPAIPFILSNFQHFAVLAVLVLLSWQYSSPPFRLKEAPMFDSISNGSIVLLCYIAGFTFPGRTVMDAPAKGYMLALCTAGVHAIGAVIDVEADVAAGQNTIAIALGKRGASLFAAACYAASTQLVDATSIPGAYAWIGLAFMLVPCVQLDWARYAFKAIVYLSVGSSVGWIGVQVLGL